MSDMIKAIVIEPTKEPEIREIQNPDDSESVHDIVGGHFQGVPVLQNLILYCNEDGRALGLPYNFDLPRFDDIVGTVVVVRTGSVGESLSVTTDDLIGVRNLIVR